MTSFINSPAIPSLSFSLSDDRFCINPFPNYKILDFSKLIEFAEDIFKFYENGRKFSKPVENIVGKGEIARYEQFLLFPQCFQKTYTANM